MTDKQKNLVIKIHHRRIFRDVHGILLSQSQGNGYPVRPHYRIEHLGVLRTGKPEGECYGKPFHQHRGGCLLLPCRGWFPHGHCGQFCGFRTLSAHHPLSLHQRTVYRQQGCHQRLGLHYALSVVHRLAFRRSMY